MTQLNLVDRRHVGEAGRGRLSSEGFDYSCSFLTKYSHTTFELYMGARKSYYQVNGSYT